MEMEASAGRSECGGRMVSTSTFGVGMATAVDQEREMVESMAAAHRDAAEEASTNDGGMAAAVNQERVIEESMTAASREEEEVTKMIRRGLINGMTGSWENVVEIYKRDPRSHTVEIGVLWDTALHMAILSLRVDTAQKLVALIHARTENDALDVLSIQNKNGNTPLHLAAMIGSVKLCSSIINCVADHRHKQLLLAARNGGSATPLLVAAYHGNKHAFLCLYEMCDTDAQVLHYCRIENGTTALHLAIQKESWDLAFQIIHKQEGLADSADYSGSIPLHLLAKKATAFRSGIYLGFFKKIIYHCIHVEELVPDTFKLKKELISSSTYPSNYQTCALFYQLVWKIIKSTVLMIVGKSGRTSNMRFDIESPEERQGIDQPHAHNSEKEAQGRQGFPSRSYGRFFKFMIFNVSKMLMFFFWTILGSSEVKKLKEAKEKHTWSLQIMNILIERAKKCTCGMNPQNHATGERKYCYSEYEYFARGRAITTPILIAAVNGVKEIVDKILQEFPMTILDRDGDRKNIVMLAAEYRQSHVYDFLLRKSNISDKVLVFAAVDGYSNSALHLAAKMKNFEGWVIPTGMLQMQWEVKWYEYVKESFVSERTGNLKNREEQYPDQIFLEQHQELLSKSKEWVNNTCNSCSFIAALIATVVFTSSATVPGGLNQDSGKPIFQHHLSFQLFSISSLVALCTSFISLLIFLTLLTTKYQYKDFNKILPQSLIFALTSLFMSMAAMLICFCSGHFLMLENRFKYGVIPVYAFTCLAISYFAIQKIPSYFVLLKTTFSKVPERIYRENPM